MITSHSTTSIYEWFCECLANLPAKLITRACQADQQISVPILWEPITLQIRGKSPRILLHFCHTTTIKCSPCWPLLTIYYTIIPSHKNGIKTGPSSSNFDSKLKWIHRFWRFIPAPIHITYIYNNILLLIPIGSMYAIYIYGNISHHYTPNVSIYIPYMDPSWDIFHDNSLFSSGKFNYSLRGEVSTRHSTTRHGPNCDPWFFFSESHGGASKNALVMLRLTNICKFIEVYSGRYGTFSFFFIFSCANKNRILPRDV